MLLDDYVAALQARRVIGQAVPVSYSVLPASGGGTPTGTVTVSDRTESCTGRAAGGQVHADVHQRRRQEPDRHLRR